MQKLRDFLTLHWAEVIVGMLIVLYVGYFSTTTILRYQTQYAHYFDLGIMHQTTYNTYKAIETGDTSRILELTDPYSSRQIKRMAIHNDILLAVLAPFYFINSSPATLLVLQALALGLGGLGIFLISKHVFSKSRYSKILSVVLTFAYLCNPVMQLSNLFDFHAVTMTTGMLIFMFYFWLKKKYIWSFVLLCLSLLAKEQLGLTTTFFGLFILFKELYAVKFDIKKFRPGYFPILVMIVSFGWFLLSLKGIMPYFRGGSDHFALKYYGDFGDSPVDVIFSLLKNPFQAFEYIFKDKTLLYLKQVFAPTGFLAFLSPFTLAIALPEFGVNLLSNNDNMRRIIYHYTAVQTPFIYISVVYAVKLLLDYTSRFKKTALIVSALCIYIVGATVITSYLYGPLPFAEHQEVHPYKYPPANKKDVALWQNTLKDESIKVASSGKLAPFFTSRRYFYTMSDRYKLADYVVLDPDEVRNNYGSEYASPAYDALQKDPAFEKIYDNNNLEVYKKIK